MFSGALLEVYAHLRSTNDSDNKWPEPRTVAHLWQGVEDHVMTAIIDFLCRRQVEHLSMHVDGFASIAHMSTQRTSTEMRQSCVASWRHTWGKSQATM